MLSTGFDTSPPSAAENLIALLKSTDVRVLAISLGGELRGSNSVEKRHSKKDQPPSEKAQAAAEGFAEADEELKAIAEANGGRAYFPKTTKDFAAVFTEIAQLVRHEYNLGFVPPTHDAKLHSIDVRLTNSNPPTAATLSRRPSPSLRGSHKSRTDTPVCPPFLKLTHTRTQQFPIS